MARPITLGADVSKGNHCRDFNVNIDTRGEKKTDPKHLLELKFMQAARSGDSKTVVECIDAGADLQCRNQRGHTALMLAAASDTKNTLDAVRFLVDALANLEAKDEMGWTPLLHAARNSQLDSVSLLIEKQASVKARGIDGKSSVMLATLDGSEDTVLFLLDKDAPLTTKDNLGWSVLYYAADEGFVELVKTLLKRRARAQEKAKDLRTPLMIAAAKGDKSIGHALVKKTASLNTQDNKGFSALMISLYNFRESFAEWLLEAGCEVRDRNSNKEDAIDIAQNLGLNALRERLERKARILGEVENAEARKSPRKGGRSPRGAASPRKNVGSPR